MFEKFARSWELVKASAEVLRSDRELMLFPVLSGLSSLLVLATFVLPLAMLRTADGGLGIGAVATAFAFYFCQYTVIVFFNVALVGAAMIRLDGGDPTLSDGLAAARARLPAILGYAAIAATVGVLLQAMKGKDNALVRLLGSGLGVTWTLATFMVVPVLVSRNVGPVDALRQGVSLLRDTWGENAIGNVGIGAAFGVLTSLAVVAAVALTLLAAQASLALAVAIGALCVLAVLLLGVYQAALTAVYSAVLYRFATTHQAPPAFRGIALQQAFSTKA